MRGVPLGEVANNRTILLNLVQLNLNVLEKRKVQGTPPAVLRCMQAREARQEADK